MAYYPLPTRVRNDPYGPQAYAGMVRNTQYLRQLFGAQHVFLTGEHNAMEVPRVQRRIVYSAGYTISPSSTDITAVSSPGAGQIDLTLASGRFTSGNIRAQVMVADGAAAKPYCWNVDVVSATQVSVRLQKLTSALGAGNTWAATDATFDIALHSDPVSFGVWSALGRPVGSGLTLSADTAAAEAFWDQFPREAAQLYSSLTAAHDSAGVHNVREVAKHYGYIYYDPDAIHGFATPTYRIRFSSSGVSSVSRTSAGVAVVNFSSLTTPVSVFAKPCYPAQALGTSGATGDIYLMTTTTTATTLTAHLFKYDTAAHTWAATDGDFWFVAHGT